MLCKNVKEIFVTIRFKSITEANFNGVDNLSWVKKIIKKKVKIEIRRRGKEVDFQGGTYSLKTINLNMFLLDIYKNIF